MREVYPGFLSSGGFMSMNLDRHVTGPSGLFKHLVQGDGDRPKSTGNSMTNIWRSWTLSAEFYLQPVDTVFIRHALPNGQMTHRGRPVRPETIRRTALLTVEGERDDISGVGQTEAAHGLCTNLPHDRKMHWLQPKVGHYGVFNGSRFRAEIVPRISDFVRKHGGAAKPVNGAAKPLPASAIAAVQSRLADGLGITALAGAARPGFAEAASKTLTSIVGIGPSLARKLNKLGVVDLKQLAEMSDEAIRGLDSR
jgi:poly(3-hydroxybutyrate) depolymerase